MHYDSDNKGKTKKHNINRRCLLGASQLSVVDLLDFEYFIYSCPPKAKWRCVPL